ncbi:MAG: hypothetical protein ACK4ND_18215 [Cytophagaceae bacterium]
MPQKDKKEADVEFKVLCDGEKVMIDFQSLLASSGMMEAYKGMKATVEGDYLDLPNVLTVGQNLKDGNMVIKISTEEGGEMATINMSIRNRKVEAKEKITTPAGTFDSYKISYDVIVETLVMGVKMPGGTHKTVEYVSKGTGMVRTESYNKNGKLTGYTVLTKFKP